MQLTGTSVTIVRLEDHQQMLVRTTLTCTVTVLGLEAEQCPEATLATSTLTNITCAALKATTFLKLESKDTEKQLPLLRKTSQKLK
jgi:hypothetical protein